MTELNSNTKVCSRCRLAVSIFMFNRNRSKRDGLATECRPCTRAYAKAHYAQNVKAYSEKSRAAYANNPELFKARNRKWALENAAKVNAGAVAYRLLYAEKIKARNKVDFLKHREKRLAAAKDYLAKNPERNAERTRARQARKQQATPAWANRDAIRAIYLECRRISQETGIRHHVDHFYPLKNPLVCGLHCEYNLRVIPAAENQSKSNQIPQQE